VDYSAKSTLSPFLPAATGRFWGEIAAEQGADPGVLRIQFNRARERAARQLKPG
jgi:hypothetical protein